MQGGTYRTAVFHPAITYAVTDGWGNFEDLPGNFLLVPPWGTLAGVNPGTSDYIGIFRSIAANAPGCASGPSLKVARTPTAIASWIERKRGLRTSRAQPATVGALQGLVLDIRMRPSWKKGCRFTKGKPFVQLITGVPPSSFDHGIIPRPMVMRLYLLPYKSGTLAIEIDDLHGGRHLKTYSALVEQLRFGS